MYWKIKGGIIFLDYIFMEVLFKVFNIESKLLSRGLSIDKYELITITFYSQKFKIIPFILFIRLLKRSETS